MSELEPLDHDIMALLEEAKPVLPIAPARKAAIFASIEAQIGIAPPDGDGGDGGSGSDGGGGATGGLSALGGAKAVVVIASTFILGVAAGVAGDRALAPPSGLKAPSWLKAPSSKAPHEAVATASVTTAAAPPASPASTAAEQGVPVSALPSVATAAPGGPARLEPQPDPAPSSRGLAAERALLDVARGSLARGEAAEALAAADRHARTYPDGAMVEEREAIAIKALVALGRRDEARARAREFERKYPNSLMLRAVKNAVEGTP